ncbi:unnamed protein product [Prorocentrum cordatum]|uniref:ABC transmembrane type-1 domain-containing protein n=1 Tax=Prorocentrum cordatum TaxID=2364126 RepID=A0ABN9PV34_9DINO|nr:unnamed protein product [Polarella glacialis]
MLRSGATAVSGILVGLARYSLALAALSPFGKVYWRCMRALRQQWERHLTGHFLETFVEAQCLGYGDCQGRARTAASDRTDRHPDQRIANDVGKFVQLCTSLSLEWLEACIHLGTSWWRLSSLACSATSRRCSTAACSWALGWAPPSPPGWAGGWSASTTRSAARTATSSTR